MTDKELLRKIMYLKEWNQSKLAQELGFNQSNISRIVHGKQEMRYDKREAAERILQECKKQRV